MGLGRPNVDAGRTDDLTAGRPEVRSGGRQVGGQSGERHKGKIMKWRQEKEGEKGERGDKWREKRKERRNNGKRGRNEGKN